MSKIFYQYGHKKLINIEKNHMTHMRLQKQARKMKRMSNKKMSIVLIGQTVKIKIPKVDQCKVDPTHY